jgi:PAT family beta-lactamase induction signal transducer AmpG
MSMLTGQGALVYLAGTLKDLTGNVAFGWMVVFGVLAAMFVSLSLYHKWALPRPDSDHAQGDPNQVVATFFTIFGKFIKKKYSADDCFSVAVSLWRSAVSQNGATIFAG